MMDYLRLINLKTDRAPAKKIDADMRKNLDFYAPEVMILMCAIIIAAIGLNLGSTAVVIGAMLISPIMGPIQTIGYSISIGDKDLLKRAVGLFLFQVFISIATSAIYFWLSPLNQATEELMARTMPTFWDVLIAIFGGLAGIIGVTRKEKTNVIPGVAIATALMPPLATVGFGISQLNQTFLFGALYLFTINSVFIIIASAIGIQLLQIRRHDLVGLETNKKAAKNFRIILFIVIVPSLITSFTLINQEVVESNLNSYIYNEIETNTRKVVSEEIDYENNIISLIMVGDHIRESELQKIEQKLDNYGLEDYQINVIQNSYRDTTQSILSQIQEEDQEGEK